jgi:hypothetical protein
VFWLIVALHLGAATDYQLGWRITRRMAGLILHGAARAD